MCRTWCITICAALSPQMQHGSPSLERVLICVAIRSWSTSGTELSWKASLSFDQLWFEWKETSLSFFPFFPLMTMVRFFPKRLKTLGSEILYFIARVFAREYLRMYWMRLSMDQLSTNP